MFSWLKRILWSRKPSRLTPAQKRKPTWRRSTWLQMERLEDRVTPSAWLVNNASGGAAAGSGQDGNLAYCVAGANADATAATITFSLPASTTVTLTSGLTLDNTHGKAITIDGSATNGLVISGGGAIEPFGVNNGANVLIENLTISDGSASNGGGLSNTSTGTLTLQNDVISDSTANGYGGGIDNEGNLIIIGTTISGNTGDITNTNGAGGGAIDNYSGGSVSISNSIISGNTVGTGGLGAGIFNESNALTMSLSGTTVSNNFAHGNGGGIENDGTLTVSGGTISGNSASGTGAAGGGINNTGNLTVNGAALIENDYATYYGGGISSSAGTATVTGSTIENNNSAIYGGGFYITGTGSATISNTLISGNSAPDGGGVFNDESSVTINGSSTTITDNTAGVGGGVFSLDPTLTTIQSATISGNTASASGGGIFAYGTLSLSGDTVENNTATNGGGIYGAATSNLSILDTTIQANTATTGDGGGIDITAAGSTATIANSTLATNSAGAFGGGIDIETGATGVVVNSTISGNSAATNGGGIYNTSVLSVIASTISTNSATDGSGIYDDAAASSLTLYDAIASANLTGDDLESGAALAVAGDFDLIGTHDANTNISAGTNDVISSSPGLGALAPNNSLNGTATMADTSSSPGHKTGPTLAQLQTEVSGLTLPVGFSIAQDERGYSRPTSGNLEIGSYQLFSTVHVTASISNLAQDGTILKIKGGGFDTVDAPSANVVTFTTLGAVGVVIAATSTQLTVSITAPPTGLGNLLATVTAFDQTSSPDEQVATVVSSPTVSLTTTTVAKDNPTIIITGANFDTIDAANANKVTFNLGAVGTVTTATATQLTVTLSTQPTSLGSLTAAVTAYGGTSAAVQVATVVAAPTVTSSGSRLGINATTLVINGTGFDTVDPPGSNTVSFNDGAAGTVTMATATALTVTFATPPAALGTLTAVVTSFGGTSGSATTVATVSPSITPSAAGYSINGNTLTINGFGFDATTPGNNVLTLSDGAVGTVTAATANTLSVHITTAPTATGVMTGIVTTDSFSSGGAVNVATVVTGPSLGALPATSGTAGFAYSSSIPISNGSAPFSIVSATNLSALGLTASISGSNVVISGSTPIQGSSSSIVINIKDFSGATANNTYSLTINPSLTLGSLSNTTGTSGTAFSGTITINGGTIPYAAGSLVVSGLPSWASAAIGGTNNSVITISGTPTTAGTTIGIHVSANDNLGAPVSGIYSITITPVATTTVTPVMANASSVTISGGGFDPTPGNNSVTFKTINPGFPTITYPGSVTPTGSTGGTLTVALPSGIVAGKLFAIVTVNGQVTSQVQVGVVSPVVTVIDPPANQATFVINGAGFDPNQANDSVQLIDNGVTYNSVTIVSATNTTITVDNPAPTQLVAGTNALTANVTADSVPAGSFQASLTPVVTPTSLTPAVTAATITITGAGFDTTASNNVVTLNNFGNTYTATISSVPSHTSIIVDLPAGLTGGPLTASIVTDGQSSGSAVQVATLAPVVTAGATTFTQGVTTTLTINGQGFDGTTFGNNTVALGLGAAGTVTASTPTQLTVSITTQPTSTGAMTAVVTTDGGVSASQTVANVVTGPAFTSANSDTFTEGTNNTFTVSASGSPAPTITRTGGTLPNGVTFSGGTLQGTPTSGTGGTYALTFSATNSGGTTTQSFTLTVDEAPTFASANNAAFTAGTAGTFSFAAATGFPTPVTFSTSALPSGVTLGGPNNATLSVSNTATQGVFTFTVTATNSTGSATQNPFTLTINPALALSRTSPLPGATVTAAYSQSITALNGTGASTLVVSSPTNTTGLNITGSGTSTVTVSGTPSSAGTVTFTVTATDSVGATTQTTYTIAVSPQVTLSPSNLAQGTSGVAYTQTITASNGTGNKTISVTGISNTTGLTIPTSGTNSITITGTPTAGTATFTVTATDGVGASTSTTYTLTVNGVITGSALTTQATVSTNYNRTITISGGTTPYTSLSISSFNANGTGITAGEITPTSSSFIINGTPTGTGTATFNINVTDSAGATLVKNYQIVVNPALSATLALATGTSGGAYSSTATITGGTSPLTALSVSGFSAGTTGFTIGSNIQVNQSAGTVTLSGTATNSAVTTVSFTVNATDSAGATLAKLYTVTFNAPLGLAPATLPGATAGTNYNHIVTVSSGTTPYTSLTVSGFSANGTGLLSSQITPNAGAGTFTVNGTPSAAGTATFTLNATDSAGSTVSQFYSITVNPAMSLSSFTAGTAGSSYNQTAFVSGGTTPYTNITITGFSTTGSTGLNSGAVSANAAAGTVSVSGSPTGAGTISFTANVTDTAGATLSKSYTITINSAITFTPSLLTLPNGTSGASYNTVISASGGTGALTLSVNLFSNSAGLNIPGSGTGSITINGTPFQGTATFTVTATDTTGASVTSGVYSININPSLSFSQFSPLNSTTANFAYSNTINVTGGTTPYTALTLSGFNSGGTGLTTSNFAITPSTGTVTISGTPTGAGTLSFNLNVTDSAGATLTQNYTLTVNPAVVITTSSLPNWTANEFYFETVQATGGTGQLTFTSTNLPSWASLDTFGDIEGTPTAGFYSIPITATDTVGASATMTYNVTIAQPLQITTTMLPVAWTTGTPYNQTISFTGGTAPVQLFVSGGSLPSGLNLSGTTIQGNPNSPGPFDFTITATDPSGASSSVEYTGTINSAVQIIGSQSSFSSTFATGTVGGNYTDAVLTSGGTTPLTFAQTGGTPLSALGLSLNTATGAITGTPSVAGNSFSITITASDALVNSGSPTSTETFSLTIDSAPTVPFTTLASWTDMLSGYNQQLTETGGSPPVNFTLSSGSGPLPNGLTLSSTGAITGEPDTGVSFSTTFNFSVIVTDANGVVSAPQSFSITINPIVTFASSTLPNWTVNQPGYFQFVQAQGGTGSLAYFVTSGTLPQGLSLDQNSGIVSGTPTQAGNSDFFITAEDTTVGTEGMVSGVNSASVEYNVTINNPVTITTTSLTDWTVNNPGYNQVVTASGGTPGGTYTWFFGTGNPPPGLVINASTGQITGTPTSTGAFTFTVVAEDSTGATGTSNNLTVNINPAITLATQTLPNWTLNTPGYNQSFGGSGGTGALTYSFTGSLPLGLTLNTAAGTLTGTPTATGTSTFTITATDTVGATASTTYSVTINTALSFTTLSLPSTTIFQNYFEQLITTGGTGSPTFAITSGSLPNGLNMTSTGLISGNPTQSGNFSFTVTATDEIGATVPEAYTLTVNPAVTVTTTTLASWTANLATSPTTVTGQYLQTLAATGGTAPLTFSLAAGSNPLPSGLSLTSSGVISGVPNSPGVYSIQVQATDSLGSTSNPVSLTISINAPPTINTVTLPDWTQGASGYNQTLSSSGGTGSLTYAISAGSLPAGMILNASTGKISGIPSAAGPADVFITATDTLGAASPASEYQFTINPSITLSPTSLPNSTTGVNYNQQVVETGGTSDGVLTPQFTISSGSLPAGLFLNNSTGQIFGAPSGTGTSTFTVKYTDTVGAKATQAYSITIAPALNITTLTLPNWTLGQAGYSQTVVATGGTGAVTFSVNPSNGLPTGLFLNSATGVISGTPTSTNGGSPFTFQIIATDSIGATSNPATYSITINQGITISTTSPLASWTVNRPGYVQGIAASGGTGTLTYTNSGLPTGLIENASNGTISGTPTTSGTFTFTVTVTDSTFANVSQVYNLTINPVLQITTNSLPSWTVGTPGYDQFINTTDGTIPITFSVSAGALPAGLNLNTSTGEITGTPTVANTGTPGFTIKAVDLAGSTATLAYNLVINKGLAITTTTLNQGTVNQPYTPVTIATSGGTPLITFAVTVGTLPAGLTLNPATGTISGTASAQGAFPITITATDSAGASAALSYNLIINPPVAINTTSLENWTATKSGYNQNISASPGTGALSYSVVSGTLPNGLNLNSSSGAITGTPSVAGTYTFTVQATDAVGSFAQQSYTVIIASPVAITTSTLPSWTVNQSGYNQTIATTGGTGTLTFTVSAGSLPSGLTLNSSSGSITGTPSAAGTTSFTIKATDMVGESATQSYTLTITGGLNITTSTLPSWTAGDAGYSATVLTSGGTPTVTFSTPAGLPPGLAMSSSGVITGTPNSQGSYTFTVTATDLTGAQAFASLTINVNAPLQLLTNTLNQPEWTAGKSGYNQAFVTTGGTPAITFALASGSSSIPAGMIFNASTGTLSGTPNSASAGTYNFTITAQDSVGAAIFATPASQTFTLTINSPITFNPTTLPVAAWTVNTPGFSQVVTAQNGTGSLSYAITGGALPNGFFMDTFGNITGTPTNVGTFNFTVTATDSIGATGSQVFSVTIAKGLVITTTSLPNTTVGAVYSQTISSMGGSGSVTYSVLPSSSSLPPGLNLIGSTITGTPNTPGVFSFTIMATDSVGATAQENYTVTVNQSVQITTGSNLPSGTQGFGYNQTIAATGGTFPLVFSLTSGSLPNGLSLNGNTGNITGTPSVNGSFSFTVQARDAVGGVGVQNFTILINPPITFTTTSLPAGTVNVSYSQNITATGGTGTLTYNQTSGTIPAGMSFNNGLLSGTPTNNSTYSFTISATDSLGATTLQGFTVVINKSIIITTLSLPNWTIGQPYNQTIAASGGTGTLTYSVSSGSLPNGLSLSGATISGTPTTGGNTPGVSNFTITVTDSVGASTSQNYTVTINQQLTITTTSLASWTVSKSGYAQAITTAGGTGNISYLVTSGALPTGLTLNSATGGITGTPNTAGTFSFSVTATDSSGQPATAALSITINPALAITTASLPNWTLGQAYSQNISTNGGGTAPITFSVSSGTLPTNLFLDPIAGTISGTPSSTNGGTPFTFTITATDSLGATASKKYSVTIAASISINTQNLENWTANQAGYSQTISASGGTGSLSFAVTANTLPPGLSLSSSGVITGTPTTIGNYPFTVTVTDSTGANAQQSYSININQGVAISTTSLASWTVNKSGYNQVISASGGTGNILFSVSSGALPAGLFLNASTGAITGTPNTASTYTFQITAKDTIGESASMTYTVFINSPLAITTSTLPNWTQNVPYSQTISTSGGTTPGVTFAVTSGSLPSGLFLDPNAGTITGTPVSTGPSSFVITATDAAGATATKGYAITIGAGITISTSTLASWTLNTAGYSQTIIASGGTGALTYSVSAGFVPGLSLSSTTGKITGTPTGTNGGNPYTFTVTVSDTVGSSAQASLSILINPSVTISSPSSLPNWTVGKAGYSQPIVATGGTGAVTYAVSTGTLPTGLSLNTVTGLISGTPVSTNSGNPYNFTITATDSIKSVSPPASYSILIDSAPTFTPTTLPGGSIASPYVETINVVGGTAPYQSLTVVNVNGGSTGVSASNFTPNVSAGTVSISATPNAGTFTFQVDVTDGAGVTATQNYTVNILGLSPLALNQVTAAASFSQTISVINGARPLSALNISNFSSGGTGLVVGNIVPNLTAGTVVVSGKPASTGVATFTVNVTDGAGNVLAENYSLVVNNALSITPTSPLTEALAGTNYNNLIQVNGGTQPYEALTVTSFNGSTTGLTLANFTTTSTAAGEVFLNGTPTAGGNVIFTVNVTDGAGATLSQAYTLSVFGVTPATLAQGDVGTPYTQKITVTNGVRPLQSLSLNGSFVDNGTGLTTSNFTINQAAGTIVINGTPTGAGTATFTVFATDNVGASISQSYTITTNPALSFGTTSPLPTGLAGNDYDQIIAVAGGTLPFKTFTVTNLVAGGTGLTAADISIDPTTGLVTLNYTPTVVGNVSFKVSATDGAGASIAQAFTFSIIPNAVSQLVVTASPNPVKAGAVLKFVVTAKDAFGNVVNDPSAYFTDDVAFSLGTTDGNALFSLSPTPNAGNAITDYVFQPSDLGTKTFYAILDVAGPQSIIATDTTNNTVTPGTASFTVTSGAPADLVTNITNGLDVNSNIQAGNVMTFTVTAFDAYGNVVSPGYLSSVIFTLGSTDANALFSTNPNPTAANAIKAYKFLPANAGMMTFYATFGAVANGQTIIVKDATLPSVAAGTSAQFNVTPGAISKLVVVAAPSAIVQAGAVESFTISAEDKYGNVLTGGYADNVLFSLQTTDANSLFSLSPTLTNGFLTNTITSYTFGTADVSPGVAVIYGQFGKIGAQKFIATDSSFPAVTGSAAFTVKAGVASQISFLTGPPANVQVGVTMPISVQLQDQYGNAVTTTTPVTLSFSGGTFSNLTSNMTANTGPTGIANFTVANWTVSSLDSTVSFTATAGAATSPTANFFVTGKAQNLQYVGSTPFSSTAGSSFNVQVQVFDINGFAVSTNSTPIGVTLTLAGAKFSTASSIVTANTNALGLANFNVTINTASNPTFNLTATTTTPGVTSTVTTVAVSPAAPSKLAFSTQPSAVIAAGATFNLITLTLTDAYGNAEPNMPIDIGLNNGSLTTGTTPILTNPQGKSVFFDLSEDTAGVYSLTANANGVNAINSNQFTIKAGVAQSIAFFPGDAFASNPTFQAAAGNLNNQESIQLMDGFGNPVANTLVTLSLSGGVFSTNSSIATASTNSSGIAAFASLAVTTAGSYSVAANAGGLSTGSSGTFYIVAGNPSKLKFTAEPVSTGAGMTLNNVAVLVTDSFNNLEIGVPVNISLSKNSLAAGTTPQFTDNTGTATFNDLQIDTAGNAYTLTATVTGVAVASSTAFNITAGTAVNILFLTQPTNTIVNKTFSTPITVESVDQFNNPVPGTAVSINLDGGSFTGGSTVTGVTGSNGQFTFSNLAASTFGTFTVTVTGNSSFSATSNTFIITGPPFELLFTTQPDAAVPVGAPMNKTDGGVVVQLYDSDGNAVSEAGVLVTIKSSGKLTGTLTVKTNALGQAIFTNLNAVAAGTFFLTATSAGLTSITSNSFTAVTNPDRFG